LCREHGLQLVNLFMASTKRDDNEDVASVSSTTTPPPPPFHLFGIIKEVGIDDLGLMEFNEQYFYHLPLFHDVNNAIYTAFGKRTIFRLRTWNPLSLYSGFRNIGQRISQQNITGNYKGEGIVQGGILIFDSNGILHYSINEEIGTPFDMDAITAALRDITTTSTVSTGSNTANNEVKEEL
jgi:hypothetical protein